MKHTPKIKLYGSSDCHKSNYYKSVLDAAKLPYQFLDVTNNEKDAEELRTLYETRKLNFPTITIGPKKLRNPKEEEIEKWLNKLIPSNHSIFHDKENKRFTLIINGEIAKINYQLRADIMYLMHAEVPYKLRGIGIGKELIEKTFEQLTQEGYTAVAICGYIKVIAARSTKWDKIIEQTDRNIQQCNLT